MRESDPLFITTIHYQADGPPLREVAVSSGKSFILTFILVADGHMARWPLSRSGYLPSRFVFGLKGRASSAPANDRGNGRAAVPFILSFFLVADDHMIR
jgi:hypothetical protein